MNKYTREIQSQLLKNKLDALAKLLKETTASSSAYSQEQILSEAFKTLTNFYKDITGPKFDPKEILPGDGPDPEDYNKNLTDASDDLTILFKELENLEAAVLQNFNYFTSENNRLQSKVKAVSSKVADYILYSDNHTKESLFFSDSFANLDHIEFDSPQINSEQCEINQVEGIITLPAVRSPDSAIRITEDVVIGAISNGTPGNNQQIGNNTRNDDIEKILDNNPDTWFEYERVVTSDDGEPLILDITLNLTTSKVVNFIRINPNNFGTKTQVEISDIQTSVDGSNFVSIKDDVPIPGFQTVDEPNIFTLAPSTSKFAGQGLFTFTPRFAKYVHIILKQTSPYSIDTLQGTKLRYAIGIRDIEVQAVRYQPEGEVVSTEYEAGDEIRKIILESSQNPSSESELATIVHQVSPDSGQTWHEIRPRSFTGISDVVNTVPETLEFNTNIDGSITTEGPFTKLKYKAILKRNSGAFTDSSSALKTTIKFTTELHQVPSTSPFLVKLGQPPVNGSVRLIDPQVGARGLENKEFKVAVGNGYAQIHNLPWKGIKPDKEKYLVGNDYFIRDTAPEVVTVGGKAWSRGVLSTAQPNSEIYELDYQRGTFKTGDGTRGKAPETGAEIKIGFTPERLLLTSVDDGFEGDLSFDTNNDQQSIVITRYDDISHFNEALPKGEKVLRLANQNLVTTGIIFSDTGVFSDKKDFLNGNTELINAGDYSIDYEEGIVYTYSNTSSIVNTTVSYEYQPAVVLDPSQWEFNGESTVNRTVRIKQNGFASRPITDEPIPASVKKFSLGNFSVVKGTVDFIVPSGQTDVFLKEVDYIDGRTELLGLLRANEFVPGGVLVGSGMKEFFLSLVPEDVVGHVIRFTNRDVFITDTSPSDPLSPGEYSIVGRRIRVYISATVANPGNVTYFYKDPTKNPSGSYSIDYRMGNVYTYDSTPSGTTADYQYSVFTVEYPIVRVVPVEDYVVDHEAAQVTLSDREIIRKSVQPGALIRSNIGGNTYQVVYNYVQQVRNNVDELEPYFTPILKDYSIRVLTRSRLLP